MTPSAPSTDCDLLRAFARGGDQRAFRALADRYAGLVFSAALRRTRHHALAEEVAQSVFAVLARKAAALAAPEVKLAAWLHRATVLEATRALRKELTRRRIMDSYFEQADALAATADPAWQAALPELDTALDSLPGRDRELLLARFFENRSYRELAEQTGRSEAALMQQQHRALEKLSIALRKRGAAVPVAVLGAALSAPLTQAAPAGLAASLATAAPVAAATLGAGTVAWHSMEIIMQTKTKTLIAATVAACFLGGTGAFVVGERQAQARVAATFVPPAALPPAPAPATISTASGTATEPALDIRAKLERAAAGWRQNTEPRLRRRALEALDALSPAEVPVALEYLASVKAELGLHQALGERIAILWGASEPTKALTWLSGDDGLPRDQRNNPMQAMLTDWSRREPKDALAWWQAVTDSLQFPIAEDAFERLQDVIHHGWAVKDPAGYAATLPELPHFRALEHHAEPDAEQRLLALATAAADPASREATVAAIRAMEHDGTKSAAVLMAGMVLGLTDLKAAESLVLDTPFASSALREELIGATAVMSVQMNIRSTAEAAEWLGTHAGKDAALRVLDGFAKGRMDEEELAALREMKTAIEKR